MPPADVLAHGVDLVEIPRIERMLAEHPERFVMRVFTAGERAYAEAGRRRRAERYAARFAAKEAALKALGTGWRTGISWTDVEVVVEPSGRPRLVLAGRCAEIAETLGLRSWSVSLSHTGSHALASVVGTR